MTIAFDLSTQLFPISDFSLAGDKFTPYSEQLAFNEVLVVLVPEHQALTDKDAINF